MTCGHSCNCPTYRDHIATVNVSSSAMPTRKQSVNEIEERQKRWDKDDDAYMRLVKQGLQPPTTEGAAVLEREATDRMEVEQGRVVGDKLMIGNEESSPDLVKEMKEGQEVVEELKDKGVL